MRIYKNHEGYHDPTVGEAFRRAEEQRKRKKRHINRLMYLIGETKSFKAIFHI